MHALSNWQFALLLLPALTFGCSKSTPVPPQAESPDSRPVAVAAEPPGALGVSPAHTAIGAAEAAEPDQAVATFLEALRAGDEMRTRAMLTAKAREETMRKGLVVEPPGSSTAEYEVTGVDYPVGAQDQARVTSVWSDTAPDGPRRDTIVWVLQRGSEGWRISGMAMELVPGQSPQLLNFEDPDDMERQIRRAEEQVAALTEPSARQAEQPPAQPIR